MRWPWQRRPETRGSGGYTDGLVRLIEARAAGAVADAASTSAVESAAGVACRRAFASATVEGPPHVVEAVKPGYLAQVGRDLVRHGQSMHIIKVAGGRVSLLPCPSWNFEGGEDPDSWMVRATTFGPSTSTTRHVSYDGVVFLRWGSTAGRPFVGVGPLSFAHLTARLQSETERSLADEMAGPLAQLLAVPADGGDGGDDDPLKMLKADIRTARGKALLLETVAAGYGEGRSAAPRTGLGRGAIGTDAARGDGDDSEDSFRARVGEYRDASKPLHGFGRHEPERGTSSLAHGYGVADGGTPRRRAFREVGG